MAAKQSEQRGAKGKSAPAGMKLGPALTLANAGEVAEALRAALAGGGKVVTLDATAVGEVDLAGLQLICATHRAAARDGRALEIVAGTGGARCVALAAAVTALGFGRDLGCGEHCLCREVAHG
jgi:ABC-type transporter Mla MlaB component